MTEKALQTPTASPIGSANDPAWMRLKTIQSELSAIGGLIEGNAYRLDVMGHYTGGLEIGIAYYLRSCIDRIEERIAEIAEELRQATENKTDLPDVASK